MSGMAETFFNMQEVTKTLTWVVNENSTSGFRVRLGGLVQSYSGSIKLLCMGVKIGLSLYTRGALRYVCENRVPGDGMWVEEGGSVRSGE
jgi:hypothetical protein